MSIRKRMTVTLVSTLLILLGAAGVGLFVYVRAALVRQYDESLIAKAKVLNSLLRASDSGKVDFDFSDDTMPEFARSKSPEYFELWTDDKTVVERSESLQKTDLTFFIPGAVSSLEYFDLQLPDGRAGRAVAMLVGPQPENDEDKKETVRVPSQQHYLLTVAREREGLDHTLTTIGVAGIGGVGFLALTFGILVPWLIAKNLRPLGTIAAQASRIDASALGTRFPVNTMPTELQPICERLNDSLDRLQNAFERERRFSADVAHELRTPISELRLLSELAIKFPKDSTEASRSFHDAHEIACQMEAIVETLLEMIATEAPAPGHLELADPASVVRYSWRAFESQAAGKDVSLNIVGGEPVVIATETSILGRIFSNLLSNAVEYAPAQSIIQYQQQTLPDRVVVSLSNAINNLAEEDLPHMTEPFWRKDTSRTGTRHAGLGLALVACYAKRLKINLQMTIATPGTFRVIMEFLQ